MQTQLGARSLRYILRVGCVVLAGMALAQCGCTSFSDWVHNGFKVGPRYGKPPILVAECSPYAQTWNQHAEKWNKEADEWNKTAEKDKRPLRTRLPMVGEGETEELAAWWCVFNDPVLNDLIHKAYEQNLTLRAAGFRILQARAQKAIAAGNILPQTQKVDAFYTRTMLSIKKLGFIPKRFFDNWGIVGSLTWELDFWGKFRRAVESADASLDASVEDYDDVLVILLSDVATAYIEFRTLQKRLALARENVMIQERYVGYAESRMKASVKESIPDYHQLKSNLDQTRALIPLLETQLRQTSNRLAILLGIPPCDPEELIPGIVPIPRAPEDIVTDIPGELLLRRPDVRRAERQLAAQSAQIGVAEADLYPQITIAGRLGVEAAQFGQLFDSLAWTGNIGPSLSWNILNFGRILNNVRFQDARFQELAVTYQNAVLVANQEAESALVAYLQSLIRSKNLKDSADGAVEAAKYVEAQWKGGLEIPGGFANRLFTVQNFKTTQQDAAAQAEGDVALNLIQLYRALGGGWQIRLGACCEKPEMGQPEEIHAPRKADEMKEKGVMPLKGKQASKGVAPARFPTSGSEGPVLLPPTRKMHPPAAGKPGPRPIQLTSGTQPVQSTPRRSVRRDLPAPASEKVIPHAEPYPPRPFPVPTAEPMENSTVPVAEPFPPRPFVSERSRVNMPPRSVSAGQTLRSAIGRLGDPDS